jgi:hypothetical protein
LSIDIKKDGRVFARRLSGILTTLISAIHSASWTIAAEWKYSTVFYIPTMSILDGSKLLMSSSPSTRGGIEHELDWDNLETPVGTFDRLGASPAEDNKAPLSTEVITYEGSTRSLPYSTFISINTTIIYPWSTLLYKSICHCWTTSKHLPDDNS